jgi:hypothetical protein
VTLVWFVLSVALMVGLAWLGFRIEPHWVSKDGGRMICNGQYMTPQGEALGRWRETKALIEADGSIIIDQRKFLRRRSSVWRMSAESPTPPKRRAVFVLTGHDTEGRPALLALKVPAKGRGAEILRQLPRR